MKVIIDLCVVPLGVGLSVSKYVAACHEIIGDAGLKSELHAYGTNIEGEWDAVFDVVKQLHHPLIKEEIEIERKILSRFGGGCHIPIGINTIRKEKTFNVRVSYSSDSNLMAKRAVFQCSSLDEALSKFAELQKKPLPKSISIRKFN